MLWLFRILAILSVAATADAAAGTAHGHIVALTCLAGALVLTALGTAVLWTRPLVAAALGWMWLTAAFAAGTVVTGSVGSAGAPAFTGFSAGDSAAIVVAMAAALAAFAGVLTVTNALGRVVIVLLAVYVVIPTAASIGYGGLEAAFTTAPLAQSRGTYAGAEVLLPLAALAALVFVLVHVAQRRGARSALAFVMALALLAATNLAAFTAGTAQLPTIVAFEHPQAVGPTSSLTGVTQSGAAPAESPAAATAGSTTAGAATGSAGGAAPKPVTIAGEAQRIGGDTAKLLARVSDGVRYEVYPGVFRGPSATLESSAGNDADKALLLHDLIRAASPSTVLRFASCTLAVPQQDQLIAAAQSGYRAPKLLAQLAGSLEKLTNSKARALAQHGALVWTSLITQARDQRTRLQTALQSANAPLAAPSAGDLRAVVANHVWLQEAAGSGWTDLDPTLPRAKPGATLCAAQTTSDDLPAQDYDTIAAAVRVEQRIGDATSVHNAVEGTWRTSDLADASLTFAFAEPAELRVAATPAPMAGLIAYTPVLRAGTAITAGQPIYVPILPRITGSAGSGATRAGTGVLQAFGATSAPSPTPTASPAPHPEIAAAWLELTVNTPGRKPEVALSTIFDRVAFADRSAGNAATANLAPLDDGEGHYLPFAALWNIGVSAGTGVAGVGDRAPASAKTTDTPSLIRMLGSVQRNYYSLRRAVFANVAGSGAPAIVNVQPGVSLLAVTWRPKTALAPAISPALLMDVASDHALPNGGGAGAATAWGVSSLLAERTATNAQRMLTAAAGGNDVAQVQSRDVLAVLDMARKANVATNLVRSPADIGAGLPADTKARLSSSLADGRVAFAPMTMVNLGGTNDYGWWLLGPDGSLRDEMQSGRHQAIPEEPVEEEVAVEAAPRMRRIGTIVNCVAIAISALGVMGSEPDPEGGEAGGQEAEVEMAIYEEDEAIEKIERAAEDGEKCE